MRPGVTNFLDMKTPKSKNPARVGSIPKRSGVPRDPGANGKGGAGHPVQSRPGAVRQRELGELRPARVEDRPGHGGHRPGAGRPPESPEGPRVYLNVKVLPSTLAKIRLAAEATGSQGKAVDEAFARHPEP
jgi:hypothetical protein